MIFSNQSEAEVNARRHASRRYKPIVTRINPIVLNPRCGELRRKSLRTKPMRRDSPPIEKSRMAQCESTSANRAIALGRNTPLSQPNRHGFIGCTFGKVRASCHQDCMKSAVRLIKGQVSDHPHSVGTTQALRATRHQDAVVMLLLRQEAVGRRKYIKRTSDVERLNAIENDECNFSLCHQCLAI